MLLTGSLSSYRLLHVVYRLTPYTPHRKYKQADKTTKQRIATCGCIKQTQNERTHRTVFSINDERTRSQKLVKSVPRSTVDLENSEAI